MKKRSAPLSGVSGSTDRGGSPVRVVSPELEETLNRIRSELGDSGDLKVRRVSVGSRPENRSAVVHLSTVADSAVINEFVLGSLLKAGRDLPQQELDGTEELQRFILAHILESGEAEIRENWNEIMLAVLSGDTAIFLQGCETAVICPTRSSEGRSIQEPTTQLVLRGPKDSFVESISTNVMLVRRRIKSPRLRMEQLTVGEVTKTHVVLMYVKGTCDDSLVDEVRRRIAEIRIDSVLDSGYIEEYIQDKTFTPFPTIYNTERPDTVAANLLEGRLAVIIDGTPFVLILPALFIQFFQSPADYSQRFDNAILMRLVRYTSFIILLFGPSVYIALTTYHYEMIPTTLLISLMAQRENAPFPAFIEAMLMEGAFEILREAGIRMPRAVGQTVSVVGGLILGQAAVEAGIVTPAMVIVVALTGIASFAVPAYNMAIAGRIVRFGFMILAAVFGFYGITLGMIVLVAHLNSLRTFGIPYMRPIVPMSVRGLQDTLLRLPLWFIKPGTGAESSAGSDEGRDAGRSEKGETRQ